MSAPVGDDLRAISLMRQLTPGTAAATYYWLNYITKFEHNPNIKYEIPQFERYTQWRESDLIPQTRNDEITIDGAVSTTDEGWIYCSALAAPTYTSGTKQNEFIGGIPTPAPVLTAAFLEGVPNVSWQGIDGQVNSFEMTIDAAAGTNKWTTKLNTKEVQLVTSTPTPVFTPPADHSPFGIRKVVITLNAVGFCVTMFKLTLTTGIEAFYCTATVPPLDTDEDALAPDSFMNGLMMGRYELTAKYTGDPASPFYDYRHNNYEALVVSFYDPKTDLGSGTHPKVVFTMPRVGGIDGHLDRFSKPKVLQVIKGAILLDGTLHSGLKIDMVNAIGNAYTGS